MKRHTGLVKKAAAVAFAACFACTVIAAPAFGSVVSSRIAQVKKVYPQNSKISIQRVMLDPYYRSDLGGCNALVGYVTQRVFHSPFGATYDKSLYKKLGVAKVSSSSAMKKLAKKAKLGDVVVVGPKSDWKDGNHYMIFEKYSSSGIYVYDANFGSKDKVWTHHLWPWSRMKSWSHGGTYLRIYHAKNYAKVNKHKAAKKLKKGKKITVDDIVYKVTSNTINKSTVKFVKKLDSSAKVAKYIGVNADFANRWGSEKYTSYKKKPRYLDEQLYTVKS